MITKYSITMTRLTPSYTPSREPPPQREASPPSSTLTRDIPDKLIKPWKLPPRNKYTLKNANVVDTKNASIIRNATVHLADGLIKSITTSSSSSSLQAEQHDASTTTIDLGGRYLCPGLFDCHVHITSTAGTDSLASGILGSDIKESYFRQPYLVGQMLARGFTSVRDTGGATLALKEAIADDVFPGPRLFIANKALSQTGGHGDGRGPHELGQCCGAGDTGITEVADGVPAVLRSARTQIRTGADFIKIMVGGGVASPSDRLDSVQFTAAEIQAIADVASSAGTFVTAHAYTPRAIRHAIDNGVRGIEHGNMVDEPTARLMAEKGVWLTPTLVTYDAMGSSKYAGFLPPFNAGKNRQVLEKGLESLRIASGAGVKICHGSDLLGPLQAEQSGEFALRARALGSGEVLRGATVTPAEMLGQKDFLGQIKEGFAADLLVLEGNPLEDVAILAEPEKNVKVVVKDGRVFRSSWEGMPTDVEQVARF